VEKRDQKRRQERQQKSLFMNLSCCCLETGLKLVLFLPRQPLDVDFEVDT